LKNKSMSLDQQRRLSESIQKLSQVNPEFQVFHIIALGSYGKAALRILVRLFSSTSPKNIEGATIALQIIGDDAGRLLSKWALDKSRSIIFRKSSILALGRMGGTKSVDLLMQIAQNKKETDWIRVEAFKSLSLYGHVSLIEPMINMLAKGPRGTLIYNPIVEVIQNISDRLTMTEEPPTVNTAIIKLLGQSLDHKNPDVRSIAIRLLSSLKAKDDYKAKFKEMAANDDVDYVKKEARDALEDKKNKLSSLKAKDDVDHVKTEASDALEDKTE